MTIAKEVLENNILEIRREFIEVVLGFSNKKLSNVIKFIKKIVKEFKGDKFYFLIFFLEIVKSIMRDALLVNAKMPNTILLNTDFLDIIKKISEKDPFVLANEGGIITELQNKILTNVNIEVALEDYFISFLKRGIV